MSLLVYSLLPDINEWLLLLGWLFLHNSGTGIQMFTFYPWLFTPTAVIGLNRKMEMPEPFTFISNAKSSEFAYPAEIKLNQEEKKKTIKTATLSVTAKAKAKALRRQKKDADGDTEMSDLQRQDSALSRQDSTLSRQDSTQSLTRQDSTQSVTPTEEAKKPEEIKKEQKINVDTLEKKEEEDKKDEKKMKKKMKKNQKNQILKFYIILLE